MLEKGPEIKDLLSSINATIFDIESVEIAVVNEEKLIERLKEVQKTIEETLRYNKPAELPESMAWSDSSDPDYEFDPFVFDGTMSLKDHKRAAELAAAAMELEEDIIKYNERTEKIDTIMEPQRSLQLAGVMTELENKYEISQLTANDHVDDRIMSIYDKASSLRHLED